VLQRQPNEQGPRYRQTWNVLRARSSSGGWLGASSSQLMALVEVSRASRLPAMHESSLDIFPEQQHTPAISDARIRNSKTLSCHDVSIFCASSTKTESCRWRLGNKLNGPAQIQSKFAGARDIWRPRTITLRRNFHAANRHVQRRRGWPSGGWAIVFRATHASLGAH
jgi:hypothetical protein